MSRKSDRVRHPTEKVVALLLSKGTRSREPKNLKASKSKGKRTRSPVEDETRSDSDSSECTRTVNKRSNGKQRRTKRARCSSPDAEVEIENLPEIIEEVEVSSYAGGDAVPMDDETEDEDVSMPVNRMPGY